MLKIWKQKLEGVQCLVRGQRSRELVLKMIGPGPDTYNTRHPSMRSSSDFGRQDPETWGFWKYIWNRGTWPLPCTGHGQHSSKAKVAGKVTASWLLRRVRHPSTGHSLFQCLEELRQLCWETQDTMWHLTPGQVWRQPLETALGAPEALRSPGLVTQVPNTLSLIGYYSYFMKPSRLLPSSWMRHLQLHFAITSPQYLS